jgi:hypothetical protein
MYYLSGRMILIFIVSLTSMQSIGDFANFISTTFNRKSHERLYHRKQICYQNDFEASRVNKSDSCLFPENNPLVQIKITS